MYGVLPPFHSFGFSVTGILPILSGLKVCYAPDPTDSYGMAHDVGLYQISLFICAPSFIKTLFRVSDPKHLISLRLVVSGAEKAPQELFDYMKKLRSDAQFIEGYGITECGPIVSMNPPGAPPRGVGPRFPASSSASSIPRPTPSCLTAKKGRSASGAPTCLQRYLGPPRDPFVTLTASPGTAPETGATSMPEGCLHISGRYKRFAKIGGEMISLGGLEEELTGQALRTKMGRHPRKRAPSSPWPPGRPIPTNPQLSSLQPSRSPGTRSTPPSRKAATAASSRSEKSKNFPRFP